MSMTKCGLNEENSSANMDMQEIALALYDSVLPAAAVRYVLHVFYTDRPAKEFAEFCSIKAIMRAFVMKIMICL